MKATNRTILFSLFMILSVHSYGQERDFIGWTSIGLEKKISKKISLEADLQLRMDNNLQAIQGYYTSLEFKYKVNKKWRAILQSRIRTSEESNVLRLGGGLNYDFKVQQLKIDIRQLYQADIQMSTFLRFNTENGIRHQFRTRARIGLDLSKKTSLSAGLEPYFRFNDASLYLARVRYALGLEYEFLKNTNIELQYLYQPNYNPGGYLRRTDYIVSIGILSKW